MASLFDTDSAPALGALHEQYRPRTWSDVVGQDKAIAKLKTLARRGLAGRAYWISGQSGTGKTTIARLLAGEIADEYSIEEIDAESLTPGRVAELERQSACHSFGKGGRAYIVNEAHGLKKSTIRQLLVTLEGDRIPRHVVWIFTTTNDGQEKLFDGCEDSGPLLSRCTDLPLARRDLAGPFAERLLSIAVAEQLDGGQSIDRFKKLLQECGNNFRKALAAVESGKMLGE
jgi:DNA polymerase-3 subunit gamma/tau